MAALPKKSSKPKAPSKLKPAKSKPAKSKGAKQAKTKTEPTRGGLAAHRKALRELTAYGLALPGAHTKSPWPGHADLAVRDKTFAYLNDDGPLKLSCKLPESCGAALGLPFTEPTEYGLGKSGWVTARFSENEAPPVAFLKAWIEESYRAQAPKRLVAELDLALEK